MYVHVFAWMCMYVILLGTVLCLYWTCMMSVFGIRYKLIHACLYLYVSCLYLSCFLHVSCLYHSVSCLYFFASCCIFQFDQVTDQWMLLLSWLRVCIDAAPRTHRGRIAVASRSHCRGCIAVAESHRGRSASSAKCRRLDDFIGISSHSFSSGLWAERQWRHLSKARSNCCGSMHWRTAVHHPTRSIELKLCIAQCMQWPSINQNMMSTILLASQQYTWLKNSKNWNTKDPL